MKKFLTFMMILITVMGMGFAEPPGNGQAPTLPNQASVTFTFTLSATDDAAKCYAGFYADQLTGADTVAKLEALSQRTSYSNNIVVDATTKKWSALPALYAAVGTNWTGATGANDEGAGLNWALTMNPFKAAGTDPLGYTVDCTIVTKTGKDTSITQGVGMTDNFATKGGTLTITDAAPVTVSGTVKAMKGSANTGQIWTTGGENGILELKFTNMTVTTPPEEIAADFRPNAGLAEGAKEFNYSATWTFQIKAN